jgi:hypothetical protein
MKRAINVKSGPLAALGLGAVCQTFVVYCRRSSIQINTPIFPGKFLLDVKSVAHSMEKKHFQLTSTQRRDWNAAHILYANNISATLVGPPVAAFYGSNVLWPQVLIIVHDPAFEDACQTLRANGFDDVLMDYYDYQTLQPPELDAEGKDAVK